MSERTLQRRLEEEASSFVRLLNDTRRELAEQYLSRLHLSLAQAAYLLGFSDQSSFFRACKRWFGVPQGSIAAGSRRARRCGRSRLRLSARSATLAVPVNTRTASYPRNVAICQTLPQRSSTMARRSPYGVSTGSSIDAAPACSARR